jgi:hypothetical protein
VVSFPQANFTVEKIDIWDFKEELWYEIKSFVIIKTYSNPEAV